MSKIVVYKYPLEQVLEQRISVPGLVEVLTVQSQRGIPTLWALCYGEGRSTDVVIRLFETGIRQEVSEERPVGRFVGTVQLDDGNYVSHFFVEERWPLDA